MVSKWVPLVFRCQGQGSAWVNPLLRVKCGEGTASVSGTHRAAGTAQGAGDGVSAARAQAVVPKATGKPEVSLCCFLTEKLHSSFNGGKGKRGNPGVKYGLGNLLADSLNISFQLKWQRREHFRRE